MEAREGASPLLLLVDIIVVLLFGLPLSCFVVFTKKNGLNFEKEWRKNKRLACVSEF